MTVCFFGHRDVPEAIRPVMKQKIERLIGCGADCFLVGNQGRFDAMALGCLREIAAKYPTVVYKVVLAYMPEPGVNEFRQGETMLPEGVESVHPKYAIAHRNQWMAEVADTAVVYVAHSWGGAAKYAGIMVKKGKRVINLYEQ